ncbi:MAG TPA: hypothetical protein PKK23_12595, partial [Nitrospirales bacterium]|nr:hypothetical protein [Nitrospirales bacterium]
NTNQGVFYRVGKVEFYKMHDNLAGGAFSVSKLATNKRGISNSNPSSVTYFGDGISSPCPYNIPSIYLNLTQKSASVQ